MRHSSLPTYIYSYLATDHVSRLRYVLGHVCSCSSDDCSNVVLKNRDQQAESQKGVQDKATQHAGTTMDSEASADHSPPAYIPAPTVALLSDDSLEPPEIDSDGDEEAAISDLEGDYSDNYSADYDDELSSDGDGLYDSEDHDCECESCRNAIFHFPPLL